MSDIYHIISTIAYRNHGNRRQWRHPSVSMYIRTKSWSVPQINIGYPYYLLRNV